MYTIFIQAKLTSIYIYKYILECKLNNRELNSVKQIIETGVFKDVNLRGNLPTLSYKEKIIEGFIEAMRERFQINGHLDVLKATKILHLRNWPLSDSPDLKSLHLLVIKGIFEIVEQVIRYNLVWVSLRLINREAVYEKRKLTQTRLCKYKPVQQFQIFLDYNYDYFV